MLSRTAFRKFYLVLMLMMLIVSFQNCGKFSQSPLAVDSTSSSSGSTTGGGMAGGTTGGGAPAPGAPQLTSTERTNKCFAAVSASGPVLNSVSVTSLEIGSGLGIGSSGDVSSARFDASINPNVTDAVTLANSSLACGGLVTSTLVCEVANVVLNKAIDISGVDVAKVSTTDKIKTVQGAFNRNGCNMQVDGWMAGTPVITKTNAMNSSAGDMNKGFRCVDATFDLKISVRTFRNDNMQVGYNSNQKTISMRIRNNCADEVALKPGADLPTLAYYGGSVAVDGNWSVIVATQENAPGDTPIEVGAAYAYHLENGVWVFKQKIQLAGAAAKDTISAVALQGSNLVLGSAYNNGTGSVTFFQLSGSTWQQIGPVVNPPDSQAGQNFGASLSLDGTTLAVGSPLYNAGGGSVIMGGAVTLYTVTGGGLTFSQMLTANDSVNFRGFGSSLSVSGSTLAVGAPQAKSKESYGIGEVYIFQKSTQWNLVKNISNAGLDAGSRFGASVAINGASLVIGIPGRSTGAVFNTGQVHYYSDWNVATKTASWDGSGANDYYGSLVKITTDKIVIGAPFRSASMGQIEVRMKAAPAVARVIRPIAAANNDRFGTAIGISGNNLVVGAYAKRDPQISSGAAFMYVIPAF